MGIKKFLICVCILLGGVQGASAVEIFSADEPVQDGLNVMDMSATFRDIYQRLDSVRWGGKNIAVAIESLENLNPAAHVAVTDERVVLVWGDAIVANFPRPATRDWDEYGQITTALILKMRQHDPVLQNMNESDLYRVVVDGLMRGIDENGRYIFSLDEMRAQDKRLLTSLGITGSRDERGNYRVSGVYKGGSADCAGIAAGDLISEINGTPVSTMSDIDLAAVMAGFNSGTVKLMLVTPRGARPVVVRRASVVLADADVIHRQAQGDDDVDILEIIVHHVSDGAVAIVNEALAKYSPDGIILDMRACGGDDERAAAKLAGLFIGRSPVMRIIETAGSELEVIPGGDAVTQAPMIALVSNMTRGTAEAIAASLYDAHRAVLVGTPTAGNARIATRIALDNGGALELLNKSIKTGGGRTLDGRGVFPIVCLSNIRSDVQRDAFFLNIINNEFRATDFNRATDVPVDDIRRGCPTITSGSDEDAAAAAVAVKILMDKKIYAQLMASMDTNNQEPL